MFEYISIWYLVFSFYNVFNSMLKMFGLIFMHFLILASMVVVSNRIELRVPHPIPKKNISHMKADPMFIAK